MSTKIEWVRNPDGTPGETWNPIVGCSHASTGCANCYAKTVAATRLAHHPLYAGLTKDGRWTGETRLSEEKLSAPLRWRKPRMIFVCSMGDLFHEAVPHDWIAEVCHTMWGEASTEPMLHTFVVLTKRPERIQHFMRWCANVAAEEIYVNTRPHIHAIANWMRFEKRWPPNVILGVSVEDQATADGRIPLLLQTPAAKRVVSCEPMLSAVDFSPWLKGENHESSGSGVSCSARHRGVFGGLVGADLETQTVHRRESNRGPVVDERPGQTKTGRRQYVGQPSEELNHLQAGDVHNAVWQEAEGERAPDCVDGDERAAYPICDAGQPHRRQRGEQLTGEPGDRDPGGEHETRGRQSRKDSQEGFVRSADGIAGACDSGGMLQENNDPDRSRKALRGQHQSNPKHPQQADLEARLDAIIAGAETGSGKRPADVQWFRDVRDQCAAAGMPFFFKRDSDGNRELDGVLHEEMP